MNNKFKVSNNDIAAALLAKNNNVNEAALLLGINPITIYRRLKDKSLQRLIKIENMDWLLFVKNAMKIKIANGECSLGELNGVIKANKFREFVGWEFEQNKDDNANKVISVQFVDIPDKEPNDNG